MAINIKFDLANNPEMPTIILANRSGNKLGKLDVRDIELNDKFNGTSEMTFTLNKYVDGKLTNLWDKVVNFKLIYCKEWDMWFEIQVELDEATQSTKTVFCVQLGQAELSQIMIYNMTINQEGDSNWNEDEKEYKKTILFSPEDPSASLLHRILKDKAPHYSIVHVDDTIATEDPMFDFDGTSIYDAFMEIAEEIGCLFVFHSNSDENGKIQRTISVYDLQQNCNSCGYRGEFTDKCPKCESEDIDYNEDVFKDTTIFVTADELATEGIQLTTDTDSVKNCFKLEAGDDLMTATIRNCNPNGTDYIWYFSEDMKSDMSEELVDKIESYDAEYEKYYNDYESVIDSDMVNRYNTLVKKYKGSCLSCNYVDNFESQCPSCGSKDILVNKDLQEIATPIKGYSALMNAYYNTVDLALYLESALMPSVEIAETNAEEQAKLLTSASLSPVAINVDKLSSVSLTTANSAVLSMAKIIVKSTFKVEIKDGSSISDDKTTWIGSFIVTNYSDEEDTYITDDITVTINNDVKSFIQQKIDKALNKDNTDDLSISGLFAKDYDEFCVELKKYALNPLTTFYDSCEACLSILTEQGVGNKETWADTTEGADSNLYEKLYLPYYNKLQAIASEIKIREDEIAIIEGIQYYIDECKEEIQSKLNFEDYIGDDLWEEFCSYRREDKYSNDNYFSDGLSNAELFARARKFIEVAEDELFKSAELQHSISSTLNNLLAIEKFKPLVEYFSVGNWIRVRVDEEVYKLRLLDYSIDYSSFDTIPVTFSDVTKVRTGITDVQDILSQASSMATSYTSVQKQAKQGDDAKGTVDQWLANGLNSAQVRIQSNDTEDVVLDRNGLLCRSYNEITDTYDSEQFRLTHNIMAFTDDNWNTVSTALGKHDYVYFDDNNVKQKGIDYGLSAKFVTAGIVNGSQIIGGDIYSDNYSKTDETGSYLNLRDGTFSFGGGALRFEGGKLLISSPNIPTTETITEINEEYLKTTSVYAQNLQVGAANIQDKLTASQINADGIEANNVNISGVITAKAGGEIGGFTIADTNIWNGIDSFSNTVADGIEGVYIGTDGIRLGDDLKLYKNGTISAGKRMYLPNGRGLRGMKSGKTSPSYDDSNVLVWIRDSNVNEVGTGHLDTTNRVVVGNANNNAATEILSPTGIYLKCGKSEKDNVGRAIRFVYVAPSDGASEEPFFMAGLTGVTNLGGVNYRWKDIYSANAVNVSSDRNVKKDIQSLDEKYIQLFDLLKPVSFKFIDGTSGRTHIGFIAQDVEDAMKQIGLTNLDFAGFCKNTITDNDGNKTEIYSLRYGEFTALNTAKIKQLEQQIIELQNEIKELKS